MSKVTEITNDLAKEVFADALRRRCGPGKKFGVDQLADATGIDRRSIDSYRAGDAAPCFSKILQIAAVLGQGFINEITAPAREITGDSDPAQTATEILDVAKQLLERCLDDGKFCHKDAAHMAPIMIELSGIAEVLGHKMQEQAKTGGVIHYSTIPHQGKVS